MNSKRAGVLFGALSLSLIAFAGQRADGALTATWAVDDYKSFHKGDAESVFISSLGEVRPGWSHKDTELDFGSSWSAQRAPDGTTFVGSDDKGRIYKVKNGKATKLAEIPDAVAVVSMALASDGQLYAGTMPGAQVWKVDTKSGKASKLATLKDTESVWALSLDSSEQKLYAGTGPNGLLYQIDTKSGAAKVSFDSKDKRVMSVLASGDGGIWFGTSDQALVFRHDPKSGKTRAVADFAGNEVSALAEWQGTIIAAANDLSPISTSGIKTKEAVDKAAKKKDPGQEIETAKAGTKPGADNKTSSDVEPAKKSERKGKGALFKIRGDGQLTQLHSLSATYFTSIAVNSDGQIFAGAADKGRIYMVEEDNSVSTVVDVDARYVAQVLLDENDELSFTTGESTALYESTGKAKSSSYVSEVFDAKTPSRFGRLVWHGKGNLRIETRSGNTAEPGVGWSAWQAPEGLLKGGGNSTRGRVKSPPGRYFQYRVRFGNDAKSVLQRSELFYLPANRPTTITGVTIASSSKSHPTLVTGAAKVFDPMLNLSWSVSNADKDKTAYELEVRREGDALWRPIHTGNSPLTSTDYKWNTETYPDGYYRLKVSSSDHLSNSPKHAQKSSWTTPLFVIDNERPKISGLSVRFPAVSARATDAISTITEMAYSIDDGPWQLGDSVDGLFDDQSEILDIRLPADLAPGSHSLSIRVADSAGNVGSVSTSFRSK